MSTGAAEKALFSVTNLDQINDKSPRGISERQKKLRQSVNFRPMSLKQLLAYIDIQDIDPELKAALRKKASSYPHAALQRFADNFDQMVTSTQRGLRKTYTVEPVAHAQAPDPNSARPTGQYLAPGVKPKVEPLPVITAKKIDLSEIEYEDSPSDLLETPVESLDGIPVSVSVNVNVKNVDIVADSSKEEEEKRKKLQPKEEPKPAPKPQPKPQQPQPKAKPAVFSAGLTAEDFE